MENPQIPLNLEFPLARAHAYVEKSRIRQAIEDVIGNRLLNIENKLTNQNQNQQANDQRTIDALRGANGGLKMNLAKKKAQVATLREEARILQRELKCRYHRESNAQR